MSFKVEEEPVLSGNRSLWKRRTPLCHPERSRGICSSALPNSNVNGSNALPATESSSREPVTFSIFRVFCTRNRKFFNPRQNRHPERSAARIYPISNGLWRGVEGPRRCLLADAFPSFPTTNYKPNQKSHKLRPERSVVERPAVLRTIPGNVFRPCEDSRARK